MRTLKTTTTWMIVLLAACTLASGRIKAQASPSPGMNPGVPTRNSQPSPFGVPAPENNPVAADMQHRIAMTRATERQKRMVADTNQLLSLATELKADMDKTNQSILSVQVLKKADEIEKLAHDIKQRMKE